MRYQCSDFPKSLSPYMNGQRSPDVMDDSSTEPSSVPISPRQKSQQRNFRDKLHNMHLANIYQTFYQTALEY